MLGSPARVGERTVGAGRTRVVIAEPDGARRPWPVLVLPDGRGLTRSYETLVELLARCGVVSAGVDLHGPVAGPDPRPDDLDQHYSRALRWPMLRADLAEAAALLRELAGPDEIVVLGFCLGGRLALLAAGEPELRVRETIALYPDPVGPARGEVPAPIDHVDSLHGPVQLLVGGADALVPAESIDHYAAALAGAGVPHEVVALPGRPAQLLRPRPRRRPRGRLCRRLAPHRRRRRRSARWRVATARPRRRSRRTRRHSSRHGRR